MARMTLDEAINHCYEVAAKGEVCQECADEHLQLAHWLEDYRNMKLQQTMAIYLGSTNDIPDPCKLCSNHPLNGGSGVCSCTLGLNTFV